MLTKFKITFLTALLLASFQIFCYEVSAFSEAPSLDAVMAQNNINTVRKALDWESSRIRYSVYSGRGWESEDRVLILGKSSCQGFASLNYEILRRLGLNPSIYIFQTRNALESDRHAVVIFKNGNHFSAISNHDLIDSKESSLQAFIFYLGLCHDLHFPVCYKKSAY